MIATATGGTWELKTDSTGHYRVPVLQPGEYEVHVAQTGFQPVARRGIQLTVGQNAVIDVKLEVGRIAEEMTVTGASPTINITSGSVSGLVSDKEIRELPLNGRSFQQLALLQTGVTPALAAGNDVVGGRAPKISINGARPEQNSFLLDGTDINNVYNKTPGSSAGVLLGRRSGARIPGADQRLLGGVRPIRRRHHQRRHAIRRQRVSRHRLRVLPQLRARREELLRSARQADSGFLPASVRRRSRAGRL